MRQRIYLEFQNCERECNKSCDIGQYVDYENCKCRKKLVDKMIECNSIERNTLERSFHEECTENIDEVKNAAENEYVLA